MLAGGLLRGIFFMPVNNSRKKIRFFIFAYWHDRRWKQFVGATIKIWDLAHNLTKLGHEVVLFLPKYHFDTKDIPFRVVEVPLVDVPIVRLFSFNFLLSFYLMAFLRQKRPHVVYVRRMTSIVPLLYAKLRRTLLFYEVNDDPYANIHDEGLRATFLIRSLLSVKVDEANLKASSRAFVISPEIKKKILQWNPGIQARKLMIMHSGANTQLFRPHNKRKCRSLLRLDVARKYIGFVGTLLAHQGIDTLIDASPLILKKESRSLFLIIGEGPMKSIWNKRIEDYGLGDFFIFSGQIDYEDVPKWIGAMDVCLAPFLRSAGLRSPVKIFDYMACEKPVVASNIKGTTDQFAGTGAIELVEPENPEILANAIIRLLGNKEKAREMGQKGRALTLEYYDRGSIAKRIEEEVYFCTGEGFRAINKRD